MVTTLSYDRTDRPTRRLTGSVIERAIEGAQYRPSRLGSTTVQIRAGGERWRKTAQLIYEYLRREMRDAESERKRIYPDTWDQQIQRTVPLIWRMSRELATLYLRAPARSFLGADGKPVDEVAIIEAAYRRAGVNRRLRTAQEHLSALANATVWVWLTSDGFRLLTPPIHDQWAFSGRVDGQEVDDVAEWRVRFPIVTDPFASSVATATALITREVAVWESGPKGWEGRGVWPTADPYDIANPFGCIPVVYLRASDPAPGEFFVPVPEDALDAQRAVNHDFTDQGTIARKQGFAQAYVKGLTQVQATELETGPEKVVGVPADGELGFASPNPDLAGYANQLDAYVKLVIACSGMSPATVMKSTGITALAKIVENIDREVERQRAKDEFEAGEQRLYDLIRTAHALRPGLGALPDGVTVRVQHREPVLPADPVSDAQAKNQRIAMRLDSSASIIATERAISLEDAQLIALKNDKLQRELGVSMTPVDEHGPSTQTKVPDDGVETSVGPPKLEAGGEVQKSALNGAQVLAMKSIVTDAAAGLIPRATARALILAAYPINAADVDAMLSPLEGFTPPVTTPGPAMPAIEGDA